MISTVVGRTLGVGAIAGALAGSLTTLVLVVGALLSPSGVGEWGWGTVIFQGLVLLVVTALAGAVAGAIAGLLSGLLLAVLRPAVATHPKTARVVAAAVSFGVVAGFAGLLATIGTKPEWIWLLTGAALAVAPVAAAWKGPYLLAVATPRAHGTHPPIG
jgi:hypothetical protein